ncbi:MAG: hypothetical protein EPN40_11270 [Rhodanobacteraceae bacterium]|nr:MAG: hypothetical protein EPN40_11270 [Rhodanobacteraceae bacterium]
MLPARPRVALVFGDAGSAGHLRDAVASHVEIVYETSATEFDASQLVGAQATAALVNLDDCDWLDPIEASLNDTGIPVVFNDPEISRNLQGWEQARWLRHLTAKLSGNSEYDPPRPAADEALQPPIVRVDGEPAGAPAVLIAVDESAMAERPLSPAEIESMTADFVAVQEPPLATTLHDDVIAAVPETIPAETTVGAAPTTTRVRDSEPQVEFSMSTLHELAVPDEELPRPAPAGTGPEDAAALDVDTEALSAMIDARLAEPEAQPSPESSEVWRVLEGGAIPAVDTATADPEPPAVPDPVYQSVAADTPPPPAVDDSDLLSALPPLEDWQLVDPEAPIAAGPKREKRPEPSISIDLAGLELVPIETIAAVESPPEPVGRWLHAADSVKAGVDKARQTAKSESNGGHA